MTARLVNILIIALGLSAFGVLAGDLDGDGVFDELDNCVEVANATQNDVDMDGIGNICDADFNQDCNVDFRDLALLKDNFYTSDPLCDMNDDGRVSFMDAAMVRQSFLTKPGPSGVQNLCGTGLLMSNYRALLPDVDGDGVPDATDNCIEVPNAAQRDTDLDAIGNMCDADFDQDCIVNFLDLAVLRDNFFTADPTCDMDGDGRVSFMDAAMVREAFFATPGPSGLLNKCGR